MMDLSLVTSAATIEQGGYQAQGNSALHFAEALYNFSH
jgi:hypothetical protein